MGGASLSAQEKVYADFSNVTTADNASWDAETQTLSWSMGWSNQLHGIEFGEMKPPYYDITEYEKLVVDCTIESGTTGYRIMFYATTKGTNAGGTTEVKASGEKEFKLADFGMDADYLTKCDHICLSGLGGSGKVKVNKMYLVKGSDPLAGTKKILNDILTVAKYQVEFGKTSASFAALTTEISKAEAALANAAATKESLESATSDLQAAIDGLTLLPGYSKLSAAMFNNGCAYNLNAVTDLAYGDAGVGMGNYATLDDFDKLIFVTYSGTPRLCMNRKTGSGQQKATQEESEMIDINSNNGTSWSAEKYQTKDGQVFTIDLNKIKTDYEYVHLHCVKNQWGPSLIVTDMLLYKEPKDITSSAELQGYKTFYDAKNNYKVDDNTTIYMAKSVSKTSVSLQAVEGKIVPKGTPVILKTTNTTDYKISLTLTAEATTADFSGNLLKAAAAESSGLYILAYTTADGLGFFKYTDALTPGQVYVDVPAEAKGRLMIDEEDEAMAISELASDEEEDGVAYNLAGQPVGDDYKGIVIKKGKKYIQK